MGDKDQKRWVKRKSESPETSQPLSDSLDEDQILVRGVHRTIAFAKNENGRMLSKEFLGDTKSDKSLLDLKADVIDVCRTLADTGWSNRPSGYKHERDKINAVTCGRIRVAAFAEGNVVFLTHAFEKKSNAWPNDEFEKANTIRKQQLARLGRRS